MDTKGIKFFLCSFVVIVILLVFLYLPFSNVPFFYHWCRSDLEVVNGFLSIICAALGLILGFLFYRGNIKEQEKRDKEEASISLYKQLEEKLFSINKLIEENLCETISLNSLTNLEIIKESIGFQVYLEEVVLEEKDDLCALMDWYSSISTGFIPGVLSGEIKYDKENHQIYREKYLEASKVLTKQIIKLIKKDN